MAKKKKGFFSAVGSFLGSIPAVGKVKKAAKKVTKKAKKAVKSAKKKIKAKKKKLKAKVKKAAKKLKKKAKKKIGKVFTKARKIKNNLSKSKMVKKIKKTMKKAVLTTKKAAKKVKKAAKAAVKVVKKVAKKAVVAAKNMDLKQAISTAADFIPVVSNAKAIYEATVGKDPFTGRKLEAWERGASAASILGGPIVKGIKHGGKAVVGIVKNGSKSTKKTTAASKPKDTPKQKKQEEKKKSDTLQLPVVNKPAEVKKQGTGSKKNEVPTAFKQTEFASSYEARLKQTPAVSNPKVEFQGTRGESKCILKPPPDPSLKRILDGADIDGINYKNAVPDFSPVTKAQLEIDYMFGGTGKHGSPARRLNFVQADQKLADQLNKSPELANQFGMKSGKITKTQIEKYRLANDLTWHELNDVKTIQLVPSEINSTFGHLGGVGEINAGAFKPSSFANK